MAVHTNRGGLRDRANAELAALQARPHQEWPGWYYGPDGQSQIFQSEDEVPEGWEDHPSKVGKGGGTDRTFKADHIGDDDDVVKDLMKKNHKDLVDILNDANADRDDKDKIEFLDSWPKLKLAKTIVLHDVAPTE